MWQPDTSIDWTFTVTPTGTLSPGTQYTIVLTGGAYAFSTYHYLWVVEQQASYTNGHVPSLYQTSSITVGSNQVSASVTVPSGWSGKTVQFLFTQQNPSSYQGHEDQITGLASKTGYPVS